jgi:hypothetical protein
VSIWGKSDPAASELKSPPDGSFLRNLYKTLAVSARDFTATVRLSGRIIAKPTRKIPYATITPNAIEPTMAQTNIVKFSASAMSSLPSLLHKIYND